MSMTRVQGTAALYCLDVDGKLAPVHWAARRPPTGWLGMPMTGPCISSTRLRSRSWRSISMRIAASCPTGGRSSHFRRALAGLDGMTIDVEGMLWIALLGKGFRVSRWNPHEGRLLDEVRLPVQRVPGRLAFGGPNLDRLYITTARFGLSEEDLRQQVHAGGLFVVEPGAVRPAGRRIRRIAPPDHARHSSKRRTIASIRHGHLAGTSAWARRVANPAVLQPVSHFPGCRQPDTRHRWAIPRVSSDSGCPAIPSQ